MSGRRVHAGQSVPLAYQTLRKLASEVDSHAAGVGLGSTLPELIKLRTSQVNGCAFCLRLHTMEALKMGEAPERLAVLQAWRETTYFSALERAALALCEAITMVADGWVSDEVYTAAAEQLSDDQLASVVWLTMVTNAFNRLSITSRYPVDPTTK